MSPSQNVSLLFLLHFLALIVFAQQTAEAKRLAENEISKKNSSISAFFVFGDSTVDAGNNNYIQTISRSNFPPYGKDLPDHIATGRFTNGKLVTDFLSSYAGIKDMIPPYLDPTLTVDDLKTGVCFASAGTGFDPLTAQINVVIPIQNQLKYFKEYKSRMEVEIGKEKTRRLINKALFVISAGTNDFMVNYYGPMQTRSRTYNISSYQDFILHQALELTQALLKMGSKKIAFVGLPPIGCVPAVITLNSDNALTHRACIQRFSDVARRYNTLLQIKLAALQKQITPSANVLYIDIYNPIDRMVRNPQQFGFEIVNLGCCGSGMVEFSVLCNSYSSVCSDDSKYLFWDSIHPTQAAYYSVYLGLRPVIDRFMKD
ncbi:GDSL esterase/lipase At5g45960-like [Salvia splendens]|uniref:GDSL esterase/lipase At5g45960-like n=1 Tax=Salvia splendens TaxID=180675 RepID=UPI001C25F72D|nr:GDSL esterase/lipase At5g45960-like [Salvia splendens]